MNKTYEKIIEDRDIEQALIYLEKRQSSIKGHNLIKLVQEEWEKLNKEVSKDDNVANID